MTRREDFAAVASETAETLCPILEAWGEEIGQAIRQAETDPQRIASALLEAGAFRESLNRAAMFTGGPWTLRLRGRVLGPIGTKLASVAGTADVIRAVVLASGDPATAHALSIIEEHLESVSTLRGVPSPTATPLHAGGFS